MDFQSRRQFGCTGDFRCDSEAGKDTFASLSTWVDCLYLTCITCSASIQNIDMNMTAVKQGTKQKGTCLDGIDAFLVPSNLYLTTPLMNYEIGCTLLKSFPWFSQFHLILVYVAPH